MVDELDLVREAFDLDPVPPGSAPYQAIRARLLDEDAPVMAASAGRRWTRRRRLLALLAVPVAGALAASGWALANRQASQVTAGIGCYASPSLQASAAIVDATGASPTAVCAQLWQAGAVAGHVTTVPPLTACVLPHGGAVGVFPDTSCDRLGLQALPAGYASAAKTYAAMIDRLVDELGQSGATTCVGEGEAVTLVEEALRDYGYTGWTVGAEGFTSMTPCAVFDPDPEDHHVTVSGQPTPKLSQAVGSAVEAQRSTCHPGDAPETAAAARRLFEAHLRAAGFGDWRVVADSGVVTTRQQPCYNPTVDLATRTLRLDSTMSMDALP